MTASNDKHINCPLEKSLSVIGNKWTFLIIRDLLTGTKRFGELIRSLEGISPRTLTLRLQELEKDGVISKKIFAEIPPRTEYSLTDKGTALAGILDQMKEWSEEYVK